MKNHGQHKLGSKNMNLRRPPRTRAVTKFVRNCLYISIVGALSPLAAQAAGSQTMTLSMQPQKDYFRESCFTLETGQQLAYKLNTHHHPIEFNLHHHHLDGAMVYPDKLVVKSQHSNQIVAESAGVYCFMATSLEEQRSAFDVIIDYEITAR
jgi:hypothetical protein